MSVTTSAVDSLAVGGGRVLWTASDGEEVSVFSAGIASTRHLLHRDRDLGFADSIGPALSVSARRVAFFLELTSSGVNDEFTEMRTMASAPLSARRLSPLAGDAPGYEQLQDTYGDAILTTAVRRIGGRWTLRAYVRDLALAGTAPRPLGPRLRLAPREYSDTVEARLVDGWLAVLRRGLEPKVTIYDRHTGRRAWTIALPRRGPKRSRYSRKIVWDLAADGTVAAALPAR